MKKPKPTTQNTLSPAPEKFEGCATSAWAAAPGAPVGGAQSERARRPLRLAIAAKKVPLRFGFRVFETRRETERERERKSQSERERKRERERERESERENSPSLCDRSYVSVCF